MTEPRPPRRNRPQRPSQTTFWIRRIVALLVLAVIIALIVFGIKSVITWRKAAADSRAVASASASASAQIGNPTECSASQLQLTLKPASESISAGSSLEVAIKVENTDKEQACTVQGSINDIGVQITTGDDTVWNSTSCNGDDVKSQLLLLGTNMEYSTAVTWDGKLYSDCKAGNNAQAGTYRIAPVVNGKVLDSDTSFVIQ